MASDLMSLYWDLASLDPSARIKAAETLTTHLAELQTQHSPTSPNLIKTEDDLNKACAPDVVYALKRLLRGLPSNRAGARQGFSVMLTELLRQLTFVPVSLTLSLLWKLTDTQGAKGQEERQIYFGRIFGLMSICQSGALKRSHTSAADIEEITSHLVKYAGSKAYLREIAYRVLVLMLEELQSTHLSDSSIPLLINTVLKEGVTTPEDLWFAVVAQRQFKSAVDWEALLPTWRGGKVLHPKNRALLLDILKEAYYTNPRVHSVWDAVISVVLAEPRKKKIITFQDLWGGLDEPLFTSTHDRKFMGFALFQKLLPLLSLEDFPFIITPHFLRCLINNLAKKDNFLFKIAKQTASTLSRTASKKEGAALPLALQLVGKNGYKEFDVMTKTKTVELILSNLRVEEVQTYLKYLMKVFNEGGEGGVESEEASSEAAEEDKDAPNRRVRLARTWAIDQMMMLVRTGKVPKTEAWVKDVAQFIAVQAFFHVHEEVGPSLKVPVVPVATAMRDFAKERFFTLLGILINLSLPDIKSGAGTTSSGRTWAAEIHTFMRSMTKNKKVSLAIPLDEESHQAIKRGNEILEKIHKQEQKFLAAATQNKEALAQYKAFELLFTHVLLQVYSEPADAVGVLEDLEKCFELFFEVKEKGGKKRKAEDEDEEPAPIEVLVDVLLSFLVKPSHLLRTLSQDVFKVFCSQLTKKALDLIIEVLTTKGGVAGAQELFEADEDGDVEMADGDEDEDWEDEDEIDADNAANGDNHSHSEFEEEDDEDEDLDDDDEGGEVDEEMRKKLFAALGNAALRDGDDEGEDDDDEGLDDDQMEEFDAKLAEIFKQKKELKAAKKDAKQQVTHFKFRVLDLLDVFLRKSSDSPLLLDLIPALLNLVRKTHRNADDKDIHPRVVSLVTKSLCKVKEIPKPPAVEVDKVLETLEGVHEFIRSAPDVATSNAASHISLLCIRILEAGKAAGAKVEGGVEKVNGKQKKKQKKGEQEQSSPASAPEKSRVATVYSTSLTDFATRKSTKVRTNLFTDLIGRYPEYAWELLPDLVDATSAEVNAKAYPLISTYQIIANMLRQNQKKETPERVAQLRAVAAKFVSNVVGTLRTALTGDEKGPRSLNKDRMKELLKAVTVVARRCKKSLDEAEFVSTFCTPAMKSSLKEVSEAERYKKAQSVAQTAKEVLKVLEGQ